MNNTDLSASLLKTIEQDGCRAKIISIEHLRGLQADINTLHQQGYFDEEFFTEELNGFDFAVADRLSGAKSLVITAAPQPQVRVMFVADGQELPCIIPPTYSHATDWTMAELIRLQLEPAGYHFKKANIPWKLLAVRSGLLMDRCLPKRKPTPSCWGIPVIIGRKVRSKNLRGLIYPGIRRCWEGISQLW